MESLLCIVLYFYYTIFSKKFKRKTVQILLILEKSPAFYPPNLQILSCRMFKKSLQ